MGLPFEGAAYDGSQDSYRISASNVAADSFFGRACLAVTDAGQQFVQPTGTAGVFLGILQHSHAIEQSQVTTDAGLPVNHPGAVLRRGRIWVVSETIVDDITDPVYYRHANAGAGPEALGRFRSDDDAASGDVTLVPEARWVRITTGTGALTVIELNLP
jgi:hypothetical protein